MTTWSKDDLHIAPFREDGVTCGTLTWIWSVVVGDMLYVRAYNGQNSRWYQAAVRQKAGRINAAGMRKEVTFEPVDGPINDLIEDAFRAKYRGSPYLGSMISARARSATVKVMPSRWRCSPLRLTLHIMIQATQSTMKAIALDRFGGLETMKLQMLPVPEVGPNEVLIHVEWAGVGQWDPFEREGGFAREFGIEPKFPYVLGSDGAGTVAAVGDRVKGLKPGDRVYAFGLLNPKGGFYAEYAAVKADDVSRIPGKLTTQQAGAITSEEASMATILIDKNVMVPMRDGLRLATDVHRLDGATPSPVLKNCFRVSVSTGFFIAID
jgi:hypothetical protein